MPSITDFRAACAVSEDAPRADRLVSAHSPRRLTWEHYQSRDGALSCGVWQCEAGRWRIRFADDKHEFFCVLSGVVRLYAEDGSWLEFGAGEAAVIPAGFAGEFEVVSPVRKYFVVYQERADA